MEIGIENTMSVFTATIYHFTFLADIYKGTSGDRDLMCSTV